MNIDSNRTGALRRMKRIALALLLAAALLYIGATSLESRHPAWSWVAAFAEAAMVGAVADWFAVVALFRHPLGLPIPHTAIIPGNQARIGRNLAAFICNNFLGTAQVLGKLREFDAPGRLAAWLSVPANAEKVGQHLAAAARYGLSTLDDERVRQFIRSTVIERLEAVDVSRLTGQLLEALTANGRHQALLDDVLRQLGVAIQNENVRARIAQVITDEVKFLRYVGLDTVAGKLATDKIVAAVGRVIGEMGESADHELRLRFDELMTRFIEKLKADPAFRLKGETIKREVLAHPNLAVYLHTLWSDVLAWLHDDLARDDSSIRHRIAGIAATLGEKLAADRPMRDWINGELMAAAPVWIDRYREDIRRYIVARVDEWNTDDMTRELERNIGRDLQFVRINGTLVGGLIGLAIHAATQWARGWGAG